MMPDAALVADKEEFDREASEEAANCEWMDPDLRHIYSKRCQSRPRTTKDMLAALQAVRALC